MRILRSLTNKGAAGKAPAAAAQRFTSGVSAVLLAESARPVMKPDIAWRNDKQKEGDKIWKKDPWMRY